jgi:deoxyadenosine/deoxycytidine kinase
MKREELKYFYATDGEVGTMPLLTNCFVYPKEDVDHLLDEKDAEIAELNARIADGDKDFEMANNQNERMLKIVRHQKYRRCLDKAALCERMRIDAADYRIPRKKWEFYDKWHKRWLELAEKFKEAM